MDGDFPNHYWHQYFYALQVGFASRVGVAENGLSISSSFTIRKADKQGYFELHDERALDVNLRRMQPSFEPSVDVLFDAIRAAIITTNDHYFDCSDCCLPVDDEFRDCGHEDGIKEFTIVHFDLSGLALLPGLMSPANVHIHFWGYSKAYRILRVVQLFP
jgi:hypothetical protein